MIDGFYSVIGLFEEFFIFSVRTNPKPNYCITFLYSQNPPSLTYANGVGRGFLTDPLKIKAGVRWIGFP